MHVCLWILNRSLAMISDGHKKDFIIVISLNLSYQATPRFRFWPHFPSAFVCSFSRSEPSTGQRAPWRRRVPDPRTSPQTGRGMWWEWRALQTEFNLFYGFNKWWLKFLYLKYCTVWCNRWHECRLGVISEEDKSTLMASSTHLDWPLGNLRLRTPPRCFESHVWTCCSLTA